jgi:RNA polymerase sigma-70 factor (ECF subfamily)
MSTPTDSATRLLAEARAGSREALGRLLARFHSYLLVIARQELDPDLRAKGGGSDLVQETFLDAQQGFGGFVGGTEGELRAWLRQLLLHNVANFSRRYRTTGKRRVDLEQPLDGGVGSGLEGRDPTPSKDAVGREQDRRIWEAMDRLPEDYRQVLLLRFREGLPFEEIGRRMNRSANAVHKLWARAVERIQREIDEPPRP